MKPLAGRPNVSPSSELPSVAVGEYLCSERELYRIEQLGGERALLEDCRSGDLVDVPLHELLLLRRVKRG
jgi:hypothetical protein